MILEDVKRRLGRLYTQLRTGSGTEGSDCGCLGDANIECWASKHRLGPDLQVAPPAQYPKSVAAWVRTCRRVVNNPSGPMMVRGDVYQYLTSEHFRDKFRRAGIRPPTVSYQYGIEFWRIRHWLDDSPDHAVLLAYHYGVAREDGAPVASESFSGGHIAMFTGAERRRTRIIRAGRIRYRRFWKSILGDSLFDGRPRPGGGRYEKGWRITRLYKFRRAAGRFGSAPDGSPRPIGERRAIAIFIERYV